MDWIISEFRKVEGMERIELMKKMIDEIGSKLIDEDNEDCREVIEIVNEREENEIERKVELNWKEDEGGWGRKDIVSEERIERKWEVKVKDGMEMKIIKREKIIKELERGWEKKKIKDIELIRIVKEKRIVREEGEGIEIDVFKLVLKKLKMLGLLRLKGKDEENVEEDDEKVEEVLRKEVREDMKEKESEEMRIERMED